MSSSATWARLTKYLKQYDMCKGQSVHSNFAAACSAYRHDMGVPTFDSCQGLPKVTSQGGCLKSQLLLPAL